MKAAIMSVTKAGSQETSNTITSVVFVNRTTKNTVASFNPRKASSATMSDYSFEFDLSNLGQSAGEIPLQAIITDDGGNTATKNLSMVAIDVTCVSVQTLNYTRETSLQVGGPRTSIPMYRFPNNASDRGIRTKIEIYKNNAWETLQEIVITDTYPHNVSIDPTGMGHGAYPIRIHGEDIGSRRNDIVGTGVMGNYLHTAVMVIEEGNTTPIILTRWYSENETARVKLYETISVDFAVYDPETTAPTVAVLVNDVQQTTRTAYRSQTYTYLHRVQDVVYDGTVTLNVIV